MRTEIVHTFKDLNQPRQLMPQEMGVLIFLLSHPFPGRDQLHDQLSSVLVRYECDADPTVGLSVDKTIPAAPVLKRVPVEAEACDADGMLVHVLLHVADVYLAELEVYREDGQPIREMPCTDSLTIVEWPSV